MAYTSAQLEKEFPYTKDCETLKAQLDRLIINETYWRTNFNSKEADASRNYIIAKTKWFNNYGCDSNLSSIKINDIKTIADNYGTQDKTRIDLYNKKQRQIRLIIGISTMILGLGIIIAFKVKK